MSETGAGHRARTSPSHVEGEWIMSVEEPVARPWSAGDPTVLELCAAAGMPAVVVALKLRRCVDAVRSKAAESGVRLVGETAGW